MSFPKISDVADRLGIEPATVRYHLRKLFGEEKKLGRDWLLTSHDLRRLKSHVETAREAKRMRLGRLATARKMA